MSNSITYPLTLTNNGSLALTPTSDLDSRLIQAVKSAVLTHREERVLRPAYGAPNVTFDSVDVSTVIADYEKAIKEAVAHFGSKVGIRVFGAIAEDGITIRVHYITPSSEDFITFAALNAFV